jgi:ethanolamine utilization protein EutP (predicted NTPase)
MQFPEGAYGVSNQVEGEPRGDGLSLIEKKILEAARYAVYKPGEYLERRTKLFDHLMREWSDGHVIIPLSSEDISVEEALNAFLEERIAKKVAAFIEIGNIDETKTIQIQADALEMAAAHRAKIRSERDEQKTLVDRQFVGFLQARQLFKDIVPAEILDRVDELTGVDKIIRKPAFDVPEPEINQPPRDVEVDLGSSLRVA